MRATASVVDVLTCGSIELIGKPDRIAEGRSEHAQPIKATAAVVGIVLSLSHGAGRTPEGIAEVAPSVDKAVSLSIIPAPAHCNVFLLRQVLGEKNGAKPKMALISQNGINKPKLKSKAG